MWAQNVSPLWNHRGPHFWGTEMQPEKSLFTRVRFAAKTSWACFSRSPTIYPARSIGIMLGLWENRHLPHNPKFGFQKKMMFSLRKNGPSKNTSYTVSGNNSSSKVESFFGFCYADFNHKLVFDIEKLKWRRISRFVKKKI